MSRRHLPTALVAVLSACSLAACGDAIELDPADQDNAALRNGARVFYDKCATCHTLDASSAEGSAYSTRDRELVDGPNLNTRNEQVDAVLYAIRNGGFSGAIMPENIITGEQARDVAEFVAKYSGRLAVEPVAPTGGSAVEQPGQQP